MNFILQNEVYYKILNEVRTPKGRISEPRYQKYFYVLHYINRCKLFDADDYETGVPMYYPVLEEILMLKSGKVSEVLQWFVSNKIIVKKKNYSKGRSSSLYKLHPLIEKKLIDHISISASESRLVKKIELFHQKKSFECKITDHQRHLISDNLTISDEGVAYLLEKYPNLEGEQEVNYSDVNAKDYFLILTYLGEKYCRRAESTKRIYSTLTSMPSHFRKCLLLNGKPLLTIDLKNAQILLSVPQIIAKYKAICGATAIIPNDILMFKELAEKGEFYEHVAFNAGIDISTLKKREAFKEKFFKQIWYSKMRSWSSNLKRSFIDDFPCVWEVIKNIKLDDYKRFSVNLQQFEAQIFIDEVLAELYKRNITALSIHDSIVTTNIDDLFTAEMILKDALIKHGLNPTCKIEGEDSIRKAS
ncbi:MAG: hypothetical protein JWR05_2294 [Mucilaginibacter sp.]|nr:hypothetical protein [Mucilaginibacter sp.]